jgi:hypothetical protein
MSMLKVKFQRGAFTPESQLKGFVYHRTLTSSLSDGKSKTDTIRTNTHGIQKFEADGASVCNLVPINAQKQCSIPVAMNRSAMN